MRLGAERFWGGRLRLDEDAVREAFRRRVAVTLDVVGGAGVAGRRRLHPRLGRRMGAGHRADSCAPEGLGDVRCWATPVGLARRSREELRHVAGLDRAADRRSTLPEFAPRGRGGATRGGCPERSNCAKLRCGPEVTGAVQHVDVPVAGTALREDAVVKLARFSTDPRVAEGLQHARGACRVREPPGCGKGTCRRRAHARPKRQRHRFADGQQDRVFSSTGSARCQCTMSTGWHGARTSAAPGTVLGREFKTGPHSMVYFHSKTRAAVASECRLMAGMTPDAAMIHETRSVFSVAVSPPM